MLTYEAKIKDTIRLHNDESEILYIDSEWSYVSSLSIWLPLSIIYVLILFAPNLMAIPSFIENWVTRARDWNQQNLGLFKIYSLLTIGHWAVLLYNRWFKSSRRSAYAHFNTILSDYKRNVITNGVPAKEMKRNLGMVRRENEFSEAHKYLCTHLPGNKILARRPIRMEYAQKYPE